MTIKRCCRDNQVTTTTKRFDKDDNQNEMRDGGKKGWKKIKLKLDSNERNCIAKCCNI